MTGYKRLAKNLLIGAFVFGLFSMAPIKYHLNVGAFNASTYNKMRFQMFVLKHVADSNDTVVLHINSPGGSVNTLVQYVNAVESSKAHTISINEGMAASAGGVLAYATDERFAKPMSVYLFHKPWRFENGVRTLVPAESPSNIIILGYLKTEVFPVLTPDEIRRYIKGEDIVIFGPEMIKRDLTPVSESK